MSKQCCEYHDNMYDDGTECGLASKGSALVCCGKCLEVAWYKHNQATRPIDFYKEQDVALSEAIS